MSFPARWRSVSGGSGTADGITATSTIGGTAIGTGNIAPGTLSCLFAVDAETNTITLTGKFQVSHDKTTWYDFASAENPANVVLATGTGGADAAVSRVFACPDGVLGWEYVRAAVVVGVVTGTTSDTYAFTFQQRVFNGF